MGRFTSRNCIEGLSAMVLIGILMVLLPAQGAAQTGPIVVINQALTDQFPQVLAYVTVIDASGLAVPNLTEAAFTIEEDGRPVSGFSASPASEEGIHIILAMDASGSMLGGQALGDAKNAAKAFVAQLTEHDRVGLIVFSESADLVADFSADSGALETAIDGITATPLAKTALHEAAFEAAERMGQLPPGRKAVVIFTDGTDTVGGLSLKDAIDRAHEVNVPIYTIGLLGGEFDPAPIRQLAESTGGTYLEAPTSAELTTQFQAVRQLLEQQYAIRYTSSLRPENRPHDLMVSVQVAGESAKDHHPFVPLPLVPWVQITAPLDGEAVGGTVPVALDVAAREPVDQVSLSVDGVEVARLSGPPYRHEWHTDSLSAGDHVLAVGVTDTGGRTGAAQVTVKVEPALRVTLVSPPDGADVLGTVDIRPDIQAVRKVKQVTILVDGTPVTTLPASPYTYRWDTSALTPGPHQVGVEVQDEHGATANAQVQVNVRPALTLALSSPADGATVVGVVNVQPDIQAAYKIEQVSVLVDGAPVTTLPASPYTYRWDTSALTPGPHQVGVEVQDEHGATANAQVQVNVQPALTLILSSPADGATVVGVVDIQPDIQAAFKLEQVVVSVDGAPIATVPAPPYTYRWDTASLAPGSHQVMVEVGDDHGLTAQAGAEVNVQPVLTVKWIAPQARDTLTETVTLLAQAQGHYGVEGVEFHANGDLLGVVKEGPYELEWPTLSLEEGDYTLSACAYDIMGHKECAGVKLELKRPGLGWGLIIALIVVVITIVGVLAMVMRSRKATAPSRVPAPVIQPQPVVPPAMDVRDRRAPEPTPEIQPHRREPATAVTQHAEPKRESLPETVADQPTLEASVGPAAWFVLQPGEGRPSREAHLHPGETTIGRSAGNDIQVDDDLISRRHAVVQYDTEKSAYLLQDQSPTNQSIINGQEYSVPHLLRPGDEIRMGDTILIFHQEA